MTVEQIIKEVAHFWNTFDFFLKTSLGVDPFIWSQFFIHMQIKLIFMQIKAPSLVLKKKAKSNSEMAYWYYGRLSS